MWGASRFYLLGGSHALALTKWIWGVQIPKGKWFLQNAANSEVGLLMIALCKSRGIKTINIVRRDEAAQIVRDAGWGLACISCPALSFVTMSFICKNNRLLQLAACLICKHFQIWNACREPEMHKQWYEMLVWVASCISSCLGLPRCQRWGYSSSIIQLCMPSRLGKTAFCLSAWLDKMP